MSTTSAPQSSPVRAPRSPGAAVAVALGSLMALVACAIAVGGAALVIAHAVLRDDDGFFTSPRERLQTPTAALTAERLELGSVRGGAGDWLLERAAARVRIVAERVDGDPVFVGIGREADVQRYLAGVAHDRVLEVGDHERLRRVSGDERLPDPAAQRFWVASASGPGSRAADWAPQEGRWAAVVANADGSRAVAAEVRVAARAGWVLWAGLGLLLVGLLGLGTGVAIAWAAARGLRGDA